MTEMKSYTDECPNCYCYESCCLGSCLTGGICKAHLLSKQWRSSSSVTVTGTCSTPQCREQLSRVKSHGGKHEDWYIDYTMCFPCHSGKHLSENPIAPHHTDTQEKSQDATEHLRCVAGNNLCCGINKSPVLYIPEPGSGVTLAYQRAHAEVLSANTYLRYFPGA